MVSHLSGLKQYIERSYNLDEFRDLCFALSVDYENLVGEGRKNKIRELILWLERRARINDLLAALAQDRPVEFEQAELKVDAGQLLFQAYDGSQSTLRQHIRTRDFQSLVAERTRNFVGRQFLFQAIDGLLADPGFEAGYIVIHGEPGIGKTSLMAELVRRRAYIHHFNIVLQNIRTAQDFLASVCAQLIVEYGLRHPSLPAAATRDSGFFSQLLHEAAALNPDRRLVILVDALDEAEDVVLSSQANRLFLPPTPPRNVIFIVTTRPQADYRLQVDWREDIYLRDDEPGNLADIRSYIESYLSAHQDQLADRLRSWSSSESEFVELMLHRSQGNFMYLVHVLRDIIRGKLSADPIDSMVNLPLGLQGYYQRHWRSMRAKKKAFHKYYEPVVCYLATAREPVGLDQLSSWTGLKPSRIKSVIDDWREFLSEERGPAGQTLYRIYHASFRDFLKEEVGLAKYDAGIAQAALDRIQW